MNNRKRARLLAKRRSEYNDRKMLHEMLDIVLDINGIEARAFKQCGKKPTAFFEFSGHIPAATVMVCTQGWGNPNGRDYDFNNTVYLTTWATQEEKQRYMESLKEFAAKLGSGAND